MPIDYALLNLIAFGASLLVTFLYRKRILAAFAKLLMKGVWNYAFEEIDSVGESGNKVRQLALKSETKRVLGVVAPTLLQEALRSIKIKTPANLPVNPVTGQLDFMAPVLQKVAAGKKVGFEDFLPLIMEKAMPYVEQVVSGLTGGLTGGEKRSATTEKLPEHLQHASK